jgi:hypothetical protein
METTPIKKKRSIMTVIIGLLVIFGIYAVISPAQEEVQPMSAANMTEEQRADNDSAVLLSELQDVDRVEIKYSVDAIKVYLTDKSSAQYIATKAEAIKDEIVEVIEKRRADLTFEKEPTDYFVYVYGSDGRLIYH